MNTNEKSLNFHLQTNSVKFIVLPVLFLLRYICANIPHTLVVALYNPIQGIPACRIVCRKYLWTYARHLWHSFIMIMMIAMKVAERDLRPGYKERVYARIEQIKRGLFAFRARKQCIIILIRFGFSGSRMMMRKSHAMQKSADDEMIYIYIYGNTWKYVEMRIRGATRTS